MKKILVPVDFSSHTGISCTYAAEVASVTGAEVMLFHSFFEQIYFSDGGFATGFETGIMLTEDIIRNFYKEKQKGLEEIKSELESIKGKSINVTTIIESGDPQVQIALAVEKQRPDLVVMGSAGLGRKGFLSGSVCKHLMGVAGTPVLAIPDILSYKGMENILYVTELESGDVSALKGLSSLLAGFSPKLHCVHLDVGQKDKDAEAVMDRLRNDPELSVNLKKIDFKVITCNAPTECLRNYVADHHIQLIAFIPHRRNFFRIFSRQDLTKEDLFMTGLPILALA
jgi:nucleotide-binding universal stress UspA family protein